MTFLWQIFLVVARLFWVSPINSWWSHQNTRLAALIAGIGSAGTGNQSAVPVIFQLRCYSPKKFVGIWILFSILSNNFSKSLYLFLLRTWSWSASTSIAESVPSATWVLPDQLANFPTQVSTSSFHIASVDQEVLVCIHVWYNFCRWNEQFVCAF